MHTALRVGAETISQYTTTAPAIASDAATRDCPLRSADAEGLQLVNKRRITWSLHQQLKIR